MLLKPAPIVMMGQSQAGVLSRCSDLLGSPFGGRYQRRYFLLVWHKFDVPLSIVNQRADDVELWVAHFDVISHTIFGGINIQYAVAIFMV